MVYQHNNITKAGLQSALPKFYTYLQINRGVSSSTFTHHKYHLSRILKEIVSFNEEEVVEFLIKLKQTKKPGTVMNYIFTLRVFCDFLVKNAILNDNFAMAIPLPKRSKDIPVIFSVSEIEKILDTDLPRSYKRYPSPKEARILFNTIFSLLAKTGARVGEVLDIRIGDINWEDGTWTLNMTKTRRGRVVPIPPDDLKRMRIFIKNRDPAKFLFMNPISSRKMSNHVCGVNFRRRLKKAGIIKNATIHTLRHSFITELMKQDISILKIASIVGHESIKTTQEYMRMMVEDMREAILRHPMTAKNRNPYEILKHIKETIDHFHLKEDPRFMVNIEEGNDGLRVSLFVR